MFLYVYVDIFAIYKPGTVRDILRGRVWEFEIIQGWALSALALMTIRFRPWPLRKRRRSERATPARTVTRAPGRDFG